MKALVTGSTGFIGSNLCKRLLELNYKVRAFHRPESPLTGLEGLDVEHCLGDVTLPETLPSSMQGIDVVFHTAAKLGKKRHRASQKEVTVIGTRNILQSAMQEGVQRVIYTSSVAALGVPSERHRAGSASSIQYKMDENHPFNFHPKRWPYGYSKYMAEMEVQRMVAKGLNVVIVNPSVVLGAGDLNRIGGNIVSQVARRRIPIFPPGGLNLVHIQDVVAGHIAALERGRTGERYILSHENMTHREFLCLIADVAGVNPPWIGLPTWLIRAFAGPVLRIGRIFKLPVSAGALYQAGFFFYYDNRKASEELGISNWKSTRQAINETLEYYSSSIQSRLDQPSH